MALTTDWQKLDPSLPSDIIKGGLATSGVFDIEPILHTGINNALSLDSNSAKRNSPVFLDPLPSTRLQLAVGALESDELRRQTRALAVNWNNKISEINALEIPGVNHFTVLDCLSDTTHPLFQNALRIVTGKQT